jgi:hypothetical protein
MSFEALPNAATGHVEGFLLPLQTTQHQASFEGCRQSVWRFPPNRDRSEPPGGRCSFTTGTRLVATVIGITEVSGSIGLLAPAHATHYQVPEAGVPVVVLPLLFAVGFTRFKEARR